MITTLNALLIFLKVLEVLCVLAVVLIGLDLAWYLHNDRQRLNLKIAETAKLKLLHIQKAAQDKRRAQKEAEAWGTFFDQKYFSGFDRNGHLIYRGHAVPTDAAWDYYAKMDNLEDTQILKTAEGF